MGTTQNWLTLGAILVALFGPYIYDFFKNKGLRDKHDKVLKRVIDDFIFDLKRILNERNAGLAKDNDNVVFNETSRSELAGYMKIFESLILNNYQISDKSSLRVIFFSHFQKNMITLYERTNGSKDSFLTVATVKKLIAHAEEAK